MELLLHRRFCGRDYTIGTLYVDGTRFCDTLEDTVRDLQGGAPKISGRTAISAGCYRVVVSRSPRFGRELPRLLDVPFFEGVLIHRGNTPDDTSGCILVGENREKGKVLNSTRYETELVHRCREVLSRGESVKIVVE